MALFGFSLVLYVVFNYSFGFDSTNKDPSFEQFNDDHLAENRLENRIVEKQEKQEKTLNDLVNIKRLEFIKQIDLSKNKNAFVPEKKLTQKNQFILPINAERLDSLLDIMLEKEQGFESIFKSLNLFVFKDMIEKNALSGAYKNFAYELENYLRIVQGKILVTQ